MIDIEEFAAARRPILRDAEEGLVGSVRWALRHFEAEGWDDALVRRSLSLLRRTYRNESGRTSSPALRAAVADFEAALRSSLSQTGRPTPDTLRAQAQAIAASISTGAIAAGMLAAARDREEAVAKVWISMEDSRVRPTHAAAHGQRQPLGHDFEVGGSAMSRPGDMRAPIGEWINCRCILGIDTAAQQTAQMAVLSQSEGAAMDPVAQIDGQSDTPVVEELPWYGVLAPENVVSGDGRKFSDGALRWRDLPLPLAWQKTTADGHNGSVTVGRIDEIYREDGLVKASGMMLNTPEADEAIGLMVDGALRGVSIDADDATMQLETRDGVTVESLMEQMASDSSVELDLETLVSNFTDARICGATLCSIPAFQEAFACVGAPPKKKKMAASDDDLEEFGGEFDDEFRDVSTEERRRLAKSGAAMKDGSYPIANCDDLKNAIRAIGRAKNPAAVKSHIKRRKSSLGCPDVELPWSVIEDETAEADAMVAAGFVKTEDGPGWLTHPVDTDRLRDYWTHGKGAAKINWGVPGDFNRCRTHLAKYVKPQYLNGYCANRHYDALGFWPGRPTAAHTDTFDGTSIHLVALVAAGALPPRDWFDDPHLTGPSPLVVTQDGRVFGHLATWGTCHIGFPGTCVTPPDSPSEYAYFRTGSLVTDGGEVAVGQITMDTGHAATSLRARPAVEHYDNTGCAACDVAIGDDEHGIWVAGRLRPGTTDEQADALRAAALSGDWREIGGHLELVAALAVNVPGFPIPRTELAASGGRQTSLVAAGIVVRPVHSSSAHEASIEAIVAMAITEYEARRRRREALALIADRRGRSPRGRMAALAGRR